MTKALVIDADTHVFEPLESFGDYLEEPYKYRSPRVFRDQWGIIRVLMEGRLYPDPSITVYEAHEKLRGQTHSHGHHAGHHSHGGHGYDQTKGSLQEHAHEPGAQGEEGGLLEGVAMAMGRQGVNNADARVKDLDLEGIDIQVVLGSLCLAACTLPDPGFALAFCRACNNFLAEFCSAYPDRLKGVAVVPLQDVDAASAEARRAVKELGLIGISIPPSLPGKNLDDPTFHPFYAEVEELNVPLGIHWGNGTYLPGAGADRFNKHFLTHVVGHPFEQMLAMTSLICGGILEGYPKLKFGFLESGCGWLPYLMWRLDEEYSGRSLEVPLLKDKPSEYIKRGQCFISCSPDEFLIPTVAETVGADTIMFSSDYPHADGLFPESVRMINETQNMSSDLKRRILGDNAARFYNLT
ncbi:hypothetical protein BH18ACI4_BH18ACI4_00250 [soil metagenome]